MFFKRKESFFLDLSPNAADKAATTAAASPAPVQVAPPVQAPAAPAATTATTLEPAAQPTASSQPTLTTAEAIAAELRAAQESRPAPSSATFAPDCLNPANAIASRRRTAGANLAGFKAMASEMFNS
jgi:negative regulator of sigma E activity